MHRLPGPRAVCGQSALLGNDASRPSACAYSAKDRFAETKELIASYWHWQVKDMNEPAACLNPHDDAQLEIRPVFGVEDFGHAMTPESAFAPKGIASSPRQGEEKHGDRFEDDRSRT
jgi:hypothetical protein